MERSVQLIIVILTAITLAMADSPRTMIAEYIYPSSALTTNHVFRLHLSTDIGKPMSNWTVVAVQPTTIISTNQYTTNFVLFSANPGWNYVTMTASNQWGTSDFFAPSVPFNPPQSPPYVGVFKQ